jgi:hypothetical protein
MKSIRISSLVFLVVGALGATLQAASIWVEGEAATQKDVSKHGWYDAVKKEGMSGGEWLSHYDQNKPGSASYEFTADEAGDFTFWWRGNPFASKVSYALNGAAPVEIDFADKRGEYMVSATPDHRFLAWVKVGKVPLKKGENSITFKFHSELANHGGIDCFLFDNSGFVPSGALRPAAAGGGGDSAAEQVAAPDEAVWIEGEAATQKDVSKHGWYDAVKKEGMSGAEWLSHYDPNKPGMASYKFDIVKADDYTFWWRGNPFTKIAYKLNAADWQEIDLADKRGEYMISEKPDHRFLAWVKVGKVALPQGDNTIAFKFHGDIANSGGIDCFCFSRVPFVPSGTNKPASGTPGKAASGDWFPVVFDTDPFSPDSVTDMSQYIEAPAGQHGFLKPDGRHLRFAKAKGPIQFWGCGANLQGADFTREQLTQRARYLRKNGVNMIRQHPVFEELGPLAEGKFDAKRLDAWDWWCAELKKNGIYMTWSVFYGQKIGPADGYEPELFNELDVADPAKNLRNTYGLVNIEPKLQELQADYLKALLLHKNAYTGLRPVDDPGLAVLEFQNEDCIFFHFPLGSLQANKWPLHAKRLRQKFFDWAKTRYGSEDALKKAWGALRRGDSWTGGELEIMAPWQLGSDGPGGGYEGQERRAGDYIHFLTDLQRGFYERREKQVRGLGYKAVTVTTAWRSGGPSADPANLYCDTAADMIDRHNYFGGGAGNHGISLGEVHDESHLSQPGSGLLSIGLYQVADRPFACTEWTQLPPNRWKLESAPLFAFYGMGLQGWDASYHFMSSRAYPGDGWPGLSSYMTDTPHYIGQFPALFFALSRNHIQEAKIAVDRHLSLDDLYSGVDPLKQDFTGGGHDVKQVRGHLVTPLETLAIGRVTVSFDGGKSKALDLDKYWNPTKKIVRSMTGQLEWDYGRQLVTLRAPKTQAIVGRAAGEPIELPGVSAKVKTPFVSLIFTPLDDKRLQESQHILITAMARDRQTNTEYSPDGKQLLAIGGPPLLMEPVEATIRLKGDNPQAVTVLDLNGVPTSVKVPVAKDGSFVLGGAFKTYYYEVKR